MIAGGFDNISGEGSYEFANMRRRDLFLLYLHIILHSSVATSPKLRSHTVVHNHHHLCHSQLVGLARKQYSNRLAWSPRVSLPPWRTLRSSMMNPVFQQSTCMVKPKPEPLASSSISLYLLTWNLFFFCFPLFFCLCLLVLTCATWVHLWDLSTLVVIWARFAYKYIMKSKFYQIL